MENLKLAFTQGFNDGVNKYAEDDIMDLGATDVSENNPIDMAMQEIDSEEMDIGEIDDLGQSEQTESEL